MHKSSDLTAMEKTRAKWRDLAGKLGMAFQPGIEGFINSPDLLRSGAWWRAPADDGEGYRKFSQDPKWVKTINDSIVGCISGEHRGLSVYAFPFSAKRGSRIRAVVRAVVLFPRPFHHGMVITSAGLPARLARAFLRKMYVLIPGGGDLNRLLLIRGKNREQISELLSRDGIREGLKVFTGEFRRGLEIRDGGIIMTLETAFPGKNELKHAIDSMADLAELFI